MRLIDYDKAIDRYYAEYEKQDICDGMEDTAWLKRCFEEAPTIDAVPVAQFVRCMNCTHWKKDVPGCTEYVGRCELANYMVGATGYCVYGDRKDGDTHG